MFCFAAATSWGDRNPSTSVYPSRTRREICWSAIFTGRHCWPGGQSVKRRRDFPVESARRFLICKGVFEVHTFSLKGHTANRATRPTVFVRRRHGEPAG